MNIVGIIHARGGSVRVPKKNIRDLGGIPLIAWTIRSALQSKCNRAIVSTDSEEIITIAREYGAEVPFIRPKEISEDVASELVTQHAITFIENESKEKVDLAVTIQPTTPFLTSDHINKGIEMIKHHPYLDSVFTAGPVHQRPEWMFSLASNSLIANRLGTKVIEGDIGISQSLPELWHPNGGAYITPRNTLFELNRLIGNKPGIVQMDHLSSVDIDEEIGFLLAETISKFIAVNTKK